MGFSSARSRSSSAIGGTMHLLLLVLSPALQMIAVMPSVAHASSAHANRFLLQDAPKSQSGEGKAVNKESSPSVATMKPTFGTTLPPINTETYVPLIVGGGEAPVGRYPYMANIVYGNSVGCGGALIAPRVVMCAAHCANGISEVWIGAHDIRDSGYDIFTVQQQLVHPNYNGNSMKNDFMLLLLDRPSTAPTLMLDDGSTSLASGVELTVMGWGTTSYGGSMSYVLKHVDVPVVSNSRCNTLYGGGILASMLCAGDEIDGGEDACQGDSGGPIIIAGTNPTEDVQVGVVSWGDGCAEKQYPGVYARISAGRSWINSVVTQQWDLPALPTPGSGSPAPSPGTPTPAPSIMPTPAPSSPISSPGPFEQFSRNSLDLFDTTLTFAAPGYTVCRSPANGYIYSIAGNTELNLGDDDSQRVTFSGGFSFPFFGNTYSRVFVGSNGFLTFDSGDSEWEVTQGNHNSQPRISALYTDLSPARGSSITYRQYADKFVVTYHRVAAFGTNNRIKMQVVLMADGSVSVTYDGTPRIRNAASIVGLSKGGSSVSLDMSEAGECAALTTPAPPSPTTTTTTPAAPPPTTTTTTAPPVTSTTPSPAPSTDLLCLEVNGDINVEWIDAGERATCVAANGDQIGSAVDCSGSFLVERMSSPQAALLAVCVL